MTRIMYDDISATHRTVSHIVTLPVMRWIHLVVSECERFQRRRMKTVSTSRQVSEVDFPENPTPIPQRTLLPLLGRVQYER